MSDYPTRLGYEPGSPEEASREMLNAVMGELNAARKVIGLAELTEIPVHQQTGSLVKSVIPQIEMVIGDRLAITNKSESAQQLAQVWGTYATAWPGGSGGEQMILMPPQLLKFYDALKKRTFKPVVPIASGQDKGISVKPALPVELSQEEGVSLTPVIQEEIIPIQEFTEIKDDAEALKTGLLQVYHSLRNVVANLSRQGAEGKFLAQALYLEEVLTSLTSEDSFGKDLKNISDLSANAPGFVSLFYGHRTLGQIHNIGKTYARVKAFYPNDNRFKGFLTSFENFVQNVNHNNTQYRIPEIPELLTPMNEDSQRLHVFADTVEAEYKKLPAARSAIKSILDHKQDERYLVVDVSALPLENVKTGTKTKATVKIGTFAVWG